jgi:penicillin-binding protein 1B
VGSTFKPVVFLTALTSDNEEINPIYELRDEPFTHQYGRQKWTPENYDRSHYGKVPMYFALKESLNLATAQLALDLGLDSIIDTARVLGTRSDLKPVPSLSLGAFELNPLELLQAYMTIARFGNYLELTFLDYIEDPDGNQVWAASSRTEENKISSVATQMLIGMLKQTVISGTAKKISSSGFDKVVAGKTGTTNDYHDSWFVGFTPDLLSIVWTGYDDNTPSGLTGASGSLPAWLSFMQEATKYDLVRDFPWTDEVNVRTIPIYDLKSKGFWSAKEDHEPDEINLVFKK